VHEPSEMIVITPGRAPSTARCSSRPRRLRL
jgi:hypothetical protein